MTVVVEESVCYNCRGKDTCQLLKRLNPGKSIRDEIENLYDRAKAGELDTATLLHKIDGEYRKRGKEIFEILVVNCTMKVQYNERERLANEAMISPEEQANLRYLYYCTICKRMHITGSSIGLEHKKIMDEQRKEVNKNEKKLESERYSKNGAQKT